MTATVTRLVTKHAHACDAFRGFGKLCRNCDWDWRSHVVACSSCGGLYKAKRRTNVTGFSACIEHGGVK